MTPSEFRERLTALKGSVIQIAGECMLDHEADIVLLIVSQQYEQNIDSTGNPLKPYKSDYIKQKTKKGAYRGVVDFHLTGDFQEQIRLSVNEAADEFSFYSPSQTDNGLFKGELLAARQGAEIMDLTPENRAKIFPIIREDFERRVAEYLQ
jgi:hypothetical protein